MTAIKLDDLKTLNLAPGINARVITGDTMTVTHVRLDAGSRLPEHKHVHEQVVNVISGELELIVAGTPHILRGGQAFVLASNVPHAANAKADCYVIDVFHPVREDFRQAGFSGYGPAAN